MKIKVSKKTIIYIMVLFPFFEPLLVDLLIEINKGGFYRYIDYLFKVSAVLFSGAAYILYSYDLVKKKKLLDCIDVLLIMHLGIMLVSCVLNNDYMISFIGSTFCSIALVIICKKMINNSLICFIKAGCVLFGAWSVYAIVMAFIFPYGYFKTNSKYEAVFGLGTKNNAFPFFFMFLLFLFAYELLKNKRRNVVNILIVVGMITAGYI